ncbi:MAG TPA: hypothetical protein VFO35_11550 [Steroidobacteraceae bacterium]|nr:hypothetical protein [Steroidobacteraceae bacterium]
MIVRAFLCVLSTCMVALHANADDVIGARVEATWRVQSLVFHHNSSVAYSCAALREKIAAILESVGAHQRTVISMECGGGLLRTARAHITLASPVVATSDVALLPAGFTARAELVARMRGVPAPAAPVVERFPATWRKVSLPRDLSSRTGDCELVRAMVKQVLPQLSTQVRRTPLCIGGVTREMPVEVVALVRDPVL